MNEALSAALHGVVTQLAEQRRPGSSKSLAVVDFDLQRTKSRDRGDWASTAALKLAKYFETDPRELAMEIAGRLVETPGIASVEVAGPGFINVRVDSAVSGAVAKTILNAGAAFGSNDQQRGRAISLEFVSANPTGPPTHWSHPVGGSWRCARPPHDCQRGLDCARVLHQ